MWKKSWKKKTKTDKWQWVNRHHLINRSRGWSDKEENIRVTRVDLHRCLHNIFGNALPQEILEWMIAYFDNVFTEEFRADLLEVLSRHKWREHNPKCYKGGKIKWGWIPIQLENI